MPPPTMATVKSFGCVMMGERCVEVVVVGEQRRGEEERFGKK
jgi:hypothetical protein